MKIKAKNIDCERRTKIIVKSLVAEGNKLLKIPTGEVILTDLKDANSLVTDLKKYPHAFVLACIMLKQIKTDKAWEIPYKISQEIGEFGFKKLLQLSENRIIDIFEKKKLHRFNYKAALEFHAGIDTISAKYNNNASNIWNDKPTCAELVLRFLEFKGVGVKIATMAANILARDFKIPLKDKICIDISPDRHVKRVFNRLGLLRTDASNEELVYTARALNPNDPGLLDGPCWQIGTNWCHNNNPYCTQCYLNQYCPRNV